jgi:hypothetical protein
MKLKTTTLAALAASVACSHAATLLQNSGYTVATTEVHYDFNNTAKSPWQAVSTDASGNGRVMTGSQNSGTTTWGNTGEILAVEDTNGYSPSNMAGMPGDNYQTTIHVRPEPNYPTNNGKMVIYYYDGVELSYHLDTYTATVGGNTIATYTANTAGIMLQKMNGVFSLWSTDYSVDGTAGTWTQRGSEVTSATSGDDFTGLHIFTGPGGAEDFVGYAGDFKIQSFAIPEPSAALLGGLGMLALLRRRR